MLPVNYKINMGSLQQKWTVPVRFVPSQNGLGQKRAARLGPTDLASFRPRTKSGSPFLALNVDAYVLVCVCVRSICLYAYVVFLGCFLTGL